MKNQIVLGSSGFLGQHLVSKLLSEGSHVVGVDLQPPPSTQSSPQFQFIQGNVGDSKIWEQLAPFRQEAEHLFHFASYASPHLFISKSHEIAEANVVGTIHALKYCAASSCRLIFASSSEVYGNPSVHPQPENYLGAVHCYGPRGSYDESKRLAESLVFCANSTGSQHGIVRIFNTYGPRQSLEDQRVIPQFVKTWKEQNVLFIHGDGNQTRSLCFVNDLIQGIYQYAKSTETAPMNLGSEEEVSILKLAQVFQQVSGTNPRIEHMTSPNLEDPKRRKPDLTRAKNTLNWQPQISLSMGLKQTLQSYQ